MNCSLFRSTLLLSRCLVLICVAVAAPVLQAQIVTNWVAFNDHVPGPIPPLAGQWGTAPGVTTYDMGVAASSGNLTNFLDGQQLPVTLSVTPTGATDNFGTAFPPNPGTPAHDLFFGVCDLSNDGIVGVRFDVGTSVTLTFDNLEPDKRYVFRGTSMRGGNYLLRWAVATIMGVDGAIDAHTGGVLTANDFPVSLEAAQAAWNSGENREGELVGWDFINPGADGSFSIVCSNYVGEIPGNQMADATRYGYSFGAMLLAEVEASAPVITMEPAADTTVEEGRPFSLSVAASGTPLQYQWYKEGVGPIGGATFATFGVAQAALEDSGDYYAVVLNPLLNVTSQVAQVTVNADVTPPGVATTFSYPSVDSSTQEATLDQVIIEFDEPIAVATATDPFLYSLNSGETVASVTLTNNRTVVLHLATPLGEDMDYIATVASVSDNLGNMAESLQAAFHTWVSGPGNALLFETFDAGPGLETALLTNSSVFPNDPDFRTGIPVFDTRAIFPDDTHDDYGARVRGVFIPPISANWVFFLRNYDRGEIRFNPNGIDPAGAQTILAEVTGNDPRDWDKFISAPFSLQAGEAYYIEGLMKAGVGTDVIKVAARVAGTGLPTLGVPVAELDTNALAGAAIGSPLAPRDLGGTLTIMQDLADVTVEEFHPISFSIQVDNPSGLPLHYQWYRDGSPIGGATGPAYTFQVGPADNAAAFSVEVAKYGSVVTSATAALTVIPDTTGPQIVEIVSTATSLTNITLVYNELMQLSSEIEDPFNFVIDSITYPARVLLDTNDQRRVVLELETPLTSGQSYEIFITGGTDLAGNVLDPDPTVLSFVAGGNPLLLEIVLDGENAVLSWPEMITDAVLEETTELTVPGSGTVWTPSGAATLVEGRYTVVIPVGSGTKVFRLRQ